MDEVLEEIIDDMYSFIEDELDHMYEISESMEYQVKDILSRYKFHADRLKEEYKSEQ